MSTTKLDERPTRGLRRFAATLFGKLPEEPRFSIVPLTRDRGHRQLTSSVFALEKPQRFFRRDGLQYPGPGLFGYTLSFAGEQYETVKQFAVRLGEELSSPYVPSKTYGGAADLLFRELAHELFPDKTFWAPAFGERELRYKPELVTSEFALMREAVKFAHSTGAPLELGYKSPDPALYGNQTVIRRVNIHNVDGKWFRAESERGFRSYSFNRLLWTVVEGTTEYTVLPPPTIRVEFSKDNSTVTIVASNGFTEADEPERSQA